jgi:hypothetical protein
MKKYYIVHTFEDWDRNIENDIAVATSLRKAKSLLTKLIHIPVQRPKNFKIVMRYEDV